MQTYLISAYHSDPERRFDREPVGVRAIGGNGSRGGLWYAHHFKLGWGKDAATAEGAIRVLTRFNGYSDLVIHGLEPETVRKERTMYTMTATAKGDAVYGETEGDVLGHATFRAVDIEDISRFVRVWVEANDFGRGSIGIEDITQRDGVDVARISYNGRIWLTLRRGLRR